MDMINRWFENSVESSLTYGLSKLNYLIYKIHWIMIFLGLTLMVFLIISNKNKYSYRYELAKWVKICFFIIIMSYLVKVLNVKAIIDIFNIVFYKLIPVILIGILLGYIFDKFIFFKKEGKYKTEIRYLKFTNTLMYTFLLISSMHGVKYVFFSIVWQLVLISFKFSLENYKSLQNNKQECTLYETRKKQLIHLKDIIETNEYGDYGISINGEWGSGKSRLIEAFIDECSKNNSYYVFIKPMVGDTSESLITQFKDDISNLMRDNGIYSGKDSSLDKYFKEILKLIQFNDKLALSDFIKFDRDVSSYKDLKNELQEDINLLLDKDKVGKKLIVVIDDFDRINEDRQLEILSFVKEIIDFKGCVTIIALDYENLKNNKIVNQIYLEKFIGTQISLVNIEFSEIISFYSNKILRRDLLNNDFSKKILEQICKNIISYHNNIDKRIENYNEDTKRKMGESSDDNKDKKEKLDEFLRFCDNRKKYIDNSRRIIHFLKEIRNSIILLDKLHKDNSDVQKLLERINVSEIVYFFNFIKVFYEEAYESIVKLKGIEKYCGFLKAENREIEKIYFEVILGEIIPKNNIMDTTIIDENTEWIKQQSLDLVNDLFIDYCFTKKNINLLTNYERCIFEIDNNCISIKNNFLESIEIYEKAILKKNIKKDEMIERAKCLVKYVASIYIEEKISFVDIIELAAGKNDYTNFLYVKYYLEEAYKLIELKKVHALNNNEKERIERILDDIEYSVICSYKKIFIKLLRILAMPNNKDEYIFKLFEDLMKIDELFKKLKKYCKDNNLIKEDKNIFELDDLLNLLLEKVKCKKYEVVDIRLLCNETEEFLLIYKYISKLKEIRNISFEYIDYMELSTQNSIDSISKVKEILEDLVQKQELSYHMRLCFHNIIKSRVLKENIDEACKVYIKKIYINLQKQFNYDAEQLYWMEINIERILNSDIGTIR